jgi:uncharacterized delta-60 repeat protein
MVAPFARMSRPVVLLLAFASFLLAMPGLAVDGDGDPTFRGTGWFVADVPSLGGKAAAVTADGRLLIGYTAVLAGTDKDMRVMPVPDSGITTHCASYHPDLGGTDDDRLADIAVYGDRVFLAGRAAGPAVNPNNHVAIAAFELSNCLLWGGFGGTDGFLLNTGDAMEAVALAIDGFGHPRTPVQAGAAGARELLMIGLSPTGDIDDSGTIDFSTAFGATSFEPKAIALQPDGKRIVVGTMVVAGGDRDIGVARLTSSGALDTTFSIDGLAGFSYDIVDAGDDEGLAVAVLPGGRIVVAGRVERAVGFQAAVAILTPTGGFQNSFGSVGRYSFDFLSPGRVDTVRALVLQGDGKIVVAGSTAPLPPLTDSDFALARLLVSGSQPLDASFGGGGTERVVFDQGGNLADVAYDLTLGQGGKITVVGAVATDNGTAIAAARLKNAYIFADGFEWGSLLGGEWGGVWGGDD